MDTNLKHNTISHSEVDQFLSCERKHYYAFGYPVSEDRRGLEPVKFGDGLYRGLIGHAALEAYYKHLIPYSRFTDGPTDAQFEAARLTAINSVVVEMQSNPEQATLLMELMVILNAYFRYWREEDKNYIFLAVEEKFRTTIDEYIDFPFTPDLIRQNRKTGCVEVVDHKFLANPYSPDAIAISPQLPKYVLNLRSLGYIIDDAVYDIIIHRVPAKKSYDPIISCKRISLHVTDKRIEQTMKEQNSVVRSIARYKSMPIEQWEQSVRRSASSFNCQHCSFLGLCISDLNGEDTEVAVKYNYLPNSYGYEPTELSTPDE